MGSGDSGAPAQPETAKVGAQTADQIENWFTYHPPDDEQVIKYGEIRRLAKDLAACIMAMCPPSADRTAAIRKVREAVMTANAAIACGGK